MCGITGFIGKGNKETLERMVSAVHHRGPDDSGVFVDESLGVGLGHSRLSILDLSASGHQPMWSADKKVSIVFNGEIYNFLSLRAELEKGNRYYFKSKTDTEVIINLYREYGVSCFEKMEGMFALALYDFSNNKLILARDRMGKKPLYYANYKSSFLFGSELKSLVLHPEFEKKLDIESVNKYLQYDYVPTPHTIWAGVKKLEAGSCLVFQNGKSEIIPFWKPKFLGESYSFDEAKERLDGMLGEAVKNRLVADVPVGVFLSGGLDSSAIAYYAKQASGAPIETFSIGFTEKSFDESSKARQVASFLGTKHHEKIFTGQDSIDIIPEVLDLLDEPMADASIIPTFLLSKFTREYVTVALGGDGGDELFAGYPTFQAEKIARMYEWLPAIIRNKVIEPGIKALPASFGNFSFDFKLKKFIEGFDVSPLYRHQVWLGSFGPVERQKLFLPDVWREIESKNVFEDVEKYQLESENVENGNRLLYQYERSYMMDEVLVKVDRATMMASLEARSPLLDYRIVDFVNSLPYSYKLHGFTAKHLFKELMKDKLPNTIVFAKKKGFGMPVADWLCGPLRPLLEDVLSKENIEKIGLFNYEYVAKLKSAHLAGKENRRKELWNLLVLMNWYLRWI
jgi:asparagine synthase (glutamine-hydrolysing)